MSEEQRLSKNTSLGNRLDDMSTQFVELFEADKNRLYAYIYAYMMDRAAADDIFQETCMVLWKDFEKFELGTNFSKWANGIAFNRVREHRYANKKYSIGLSDDFLEEFCQDIAATDLKQVTKQEKKWFYLEECCLHLSTPLLHIYQNFYVKNMKAQEIADKTGRSIYAIRKAIRKLRQKLHDCVNDKLRGD